MKIFTIILTFFFALSCESQQSSSGYVLMNSDGTPRIPAGSITNAMLQNVPLSASVIGDSLNLIRTQLNTKQSIPVAGQGTGGTITQQTNKTTAVTLNKICGQITMNNAALAAAAEVAFTVNNNLVAATDVIIANIQSVGTAGSYLISVGAVSSGSFSLTISNASGGSLSQAIVINFYVLKGVNN